MSAPPGAGVGVAAARAAAHQRDRLALGVAMIVIALAPGDSLDLLDLRPPEPGHAAPEVNPSATSLVQLAASVPVVFEVIVSVPVRLLARQPVAPLLADEEGTCPLIRDPRPRWT